MSITLYKQMQVKRQRLSKELTALQDRIHTLPDGKLVCTRNGDQIKWYQSDGHKLTYISKKNPHLAEQLAAKKYYSLQASYLIQEQRAIDFYLRHHPVDEKRAERLLTETPGYTQLLSPLFCPSSQELLDWMNSPYEHNNKNPDQLIHKTLSGDYVRSKSEAIIAMLLHINKIPFRYECALHLNETTIFPDFTIRHPETGKIFYWEHFGMMDNPSYCKNVCSKLYLYASNEIIPTINLITTYETKEEPLDSEFAEEMIKLYFLRG